MTLETPVERKAEAQGAQHGLPPRRRRDRRDQIARPVDPACRAGRATTPRDGRPAERPCCDRSFPDRKPKQSGVRAMNAAPLRADLVEQTRRDDANVHHVEVGLDDRGSRHTQGLERARPDSWRTRPRPGSFPRSEQAASTCLASSAAQDFETADCGVAGRRGSPFRRRFRLRSAERLMRVGREIWRLRPVVVAGLGGDHEPVRACPPTPCRSAPRYGPRTVGAGRVEEGDTAGRAPAPAPPATARRRYRRRTCAPAVLPPMPQAPNPISETRMPVPPSLRYFIASPQDQ